MNFFENVCERNNGGRRSVFSFMCGGSRSLLFSGALCFVLSAVVANADPAAELQVLKQRIDELEKVLEQEKEKTDVLVTEVADTKVTRMVPKKKELKSLYGFGPSASSVYQVDQGLSLAGYGEAYYQNILSDAGTKRDVSDALRTVGYFGYRFNDWIVMNSEVEFEHGSTEGGASGENGSVSVEFSYLDFFLDPAANIRAGLVLVPMGFINEIHEPVYFHGVQRPEVERYLIPSTWREMGAGVFGKFGGDFEYRTYLLNGLRANSFSDSGIRAARQSGAEAITEDLAWVGRLDYTPTDIIPGLLVGTALYTGNAGQDDTFANGSTPSVRTTLFEGHAQYKASGLELRALGVWTHISDANLVSQQVGSTVGNRQFGWYTEAAYDVLPLLGDPNGHYLAPFVRYEQLDTQASVPTGLTANPLQDRSVYSIGLTYKPITQVAIKGEYRALESRSNEEDLPDSFYAGVGFAF
jgi:hypothetical protein